jgi:hypothetical protein
MKVLMEWALYGDRGGDEDEYTTPISKGIPSSIRADITANYGVIYGLQESIAAGWLVDRARETCSFAHDRYRHAVESEIEKMSKESTARISLKVYFVMSSCVSISMPKTVDHLDAAGRMRSGRV